MEKKLKTKKYKNMSKILWEISITTIILTIVEIALVGVFCGLYLSDTIEGMHENFKVDYIAYGVLVIVLINLLFLVFGIFRLYSIREASDLKISDVVGEEVKEAYNFSKIALIITNEDGSVIWENDYAIAQNLIDINENIYEKFKDSEGFLSLKSASEDKTIKIVVKDKNEILSDKHYNVEYLRKANIFIFKDITDYEELDELRKNEDTCIGLIMIDNYDDIIGNNGQQNSMIVDVKDIIYKYAKANNVLLRSIKSDQFFAVCNYASLQKMMDDKFATLLNGVHDCKDEYIKPTLSIGFAHFLLGGVNKLNDLAARALDLSLNRGGDQAYVYDNDLDGKERGYIFGGNTEATEEKNKVLVVRTANNLVNLIREASEVLIMGHIRTDMDALGASLGVKAICEYENKTSHIVYDYSLTEAKTRNAFTSMFSKDTIDKITISPKSALDHLAKNKSGTLLILVDVSRLSKLLEQDLANDAQNIVVIDHHRKDTDSIRQPVLEHIQTDASSASELVVELIKYMPNVSANDPVLKDKQYATIMLSGIYLDTNFFKSNRVGLRTFEAARFLTSYGADNVVASDILKDEPNEYSIVYKILLTMKTYTPGIVYCTSDENEYYEDAVYAKVANQCLQLKGIKAAFCIGKISKNKVKISARSDGSFNVEIVMEKLGGGGSLAMAATNIKDKTVKEVENDLLVALKSVSKELEEYNLGKKK